MCIAPDNDWGHKYLQVSEASICILLAIGLSLYVNADAFFTINDGDEIGLDDAWYLMQGIEYPTSHVLVFDDHALIEELRDGIVMVHLNMERKHIFGACYTSNIVDFLHSAVQGTASVGGYFSPSTTLSPPPARQQPQVTLLALI
ncbi:hypothetical protein CC80DRAFT_509863 [Byssothecium circinans]|uniref:Uncharacterized protein n=1 Tax=Byssothecium circinans TaxID=147558 RepID=A0A6A5THN7_9PLEO|nr:hypothetical protein CC80DRAFT_509863 [Byssothecium circinans]